VDREKNGNQSHSTIKPDVLSCPGLGQQSLHREAKIQVKKKDIS
jgi:hypothetical protein